MSFIQYASGSFAIEVEGDYHCGPNHETPKTFDFEVEVEWPNGSLDMNGFLLDNLSFGQFFARCGRTSLSCELFVLECAKEFFRLTDGKPNCIKIGIWAIPKAVKVVKVLTREEWIEGGR